MSAYLFTNINKSLIKKAQVEYTSMIGEKEAGEIVMPGDTIKIVTPQNPKEKIILGPGLRRDGDNLYACKAGLLKLRTPSIYYVDSYQRR